MEKKKIESFAFGKMLLWAFVSLLASVLLWVYVTTSEGDVTEVPFDGVQVVFRGDENLSRDGLVISNISANTVNVRINATRRELTKLSSDKLTAVVDVSKSTTKGRYTLAVSIEYPPGSNKSSIEVASVSPGSISFSVDKTSSKAIPLEGKFSGTLEDGFAAQPIKFEPQIVTISGPESELSRVAYAWVEIANRENVNRTIQIVSSYELMDEDGNIIDKVGFELSEETVSVTVPITSTKTVPLTVDIVEGGGATMENVNITCVPETITIAGDAETLEGINKISLGTIDLTDFAVSFEDTYQIVLDNNVTNVTGIKEAKVTVKVVGLETKKFNVSNITTINAPSGRKVTMVTENVEVMLRGKSSVLSKVAANNIRVVADLADTGSTTGVFQPPVKVYVDGVTGVGAIGEYSESVYVKLS